jgi:hypothetical protein
MGPCIARMFQYISNKMQGYTGYFISKPPHMFRVLTPPIIRSANNCIGSIWYLSHRYCYLPLAEGSSNGVTNTSRCRYSCMRSWWWEEVPPETCRAVSRYNKLCNVASCWIYIGICLHYSFTYWLLTKIKLIWDIMPCRCIFLMFRRITLLSSLRLINPLLGQHVECTRIYRNVCNK